MTRIIEEQFRAYVPSYGILKIKKIDFVNKIVDLANIKVINHRVKNPILINNTGKKIGVTPLFEGDVFEKIGTDKKYLIYFDIYSTRFLIKPLYETGRQPIFNKSTLSSDVYRVIGNVLQFSKDDITNKYNIGFKLE